jgi:hypothetical protein
VDAALGMLLILGANPRNQQLSDITGMFVAYFLDDEALSRG